MRILLIHNHYLEQGGEDEVVRTEKAMLKRFGHEVIFYERSNAELSHLNPLQKIRYFTRDIFWSKKTYEEVCQIINEQKPDIAHIHNTFLMISPSVYEACFEKRIPVVQTLHNYRFLCPIGTFYRKTKVCEDCLKTGKKSAVIHRCYKNSYIASSILINIIRFFFQNKILSQKINHFIVLSEFSLKKYLDNGFPTEKFSIKPNFLDFDPGISETQGQYALFVGGFFPYKGIRTLLKAWDKLKEDFPLKMIGDGPLFKRLKERFGKSNIEFLGRKPFKEILEYLKGALFVIVPSECYENFPRIIVEAYACGIPVIASNLGAMKDLVKDHSHGLLFEAGNSDDLALKITHLIRNKALVQELGKNAREEYMRKYTFERNYESLMEIYKIFKK